MRKVTLISFYPGFFGLNLRLIGACLRGAGFDVKYLHLGYASYKIGQRFPLLSRGFNPELITDSILSEIEGSLYIGISLTASEFNASKMLTTSLKKRIDIPIVWGGPHPTSSIEQSTPYTDYVCVGEGENFAVELAKKLELGEDISNLNNLAYIKNGEIQCNTLNPIISNLDNLPIPDTDIYKQKVYFDGKIRELTPELLLDLDSTYIRPVPGKAIYITTLTRGCPFNCSYCNNSYIRRIYKGEKYFRYRSLNHLFREIKQAINDIKVLGAIFLADDNLTTLPNSLLEEFAERWKDEVGIPFGTSGSPATLRDDKLQILAETGLLYKFGVGIESGSEHILKDIYNRRETPALAAKAVAMVEKYRPLFFQKYKRPLINYQFIFDNPYETNADVAKSLRFIADNIPERDSVTSFSLVMYPGSDIYLKAKKDGLQHLDQDIYTETYGDLEPRFPKLWLKLFHHGVSKYIMQFLSQKAVFIFLNSYPLRWIYKKFL